MIKWLSSLLLCYILDLPKDPTDIHEGPHGLLGDAFDEYGYCSRCGKLVTRDRAFLTGGSNWSHERLNPFNI